MTRRRGYVRARKKRSGDLRQGARNQRQQTLDEAAAIYLDHLHREDSGPARNWNNAPVPGTYRRPRPPAVPRTEQRDGTRLEPVSRSSVEDIGPDEFFDGRYFVQDAEGNITFIKVRKRP
jgi:hypothetical protein